MSKYCQNRLSLAVFVFLWDMANILVGIWKRVWKMYPMGFRTNPVNLQSDVGTGSYTNCIATPINRRLLKRRQSGGENEQ